MAAIVYKTFKGEIPREEPHLLPDMYAQLAENCDFARGALSPMKDGSLLRTMSTNPTRGIYTEDGISFFTWTEETQAFGSPIIDDPYNRMYYLTPSDGLLRVASKLQMSFSGGPPTQSVLAGVPKPTVAPVLTLIERATYPDYPSVQVSCDAWWEVGGVAYGKITVALNAVSPLRRYAFYTPALPEDTPAGAVLAAVLRIKNTADNSEIASFPVRAGSSVRVSSIPGTAEASLSVIDDTGVIDITYGVYETRAYTYVYENTWDEESAPAPPATISPTYVQDVRIVVASTDFSGYQPLKRVNVYRTYGGADTYVRVKVTGSSGSYIDNTVTPTDVGTTLISADFYPVTQGLQGAVALPNGWFAAFKDKTLYMSEPYRPHAWPYSMTFPSSIRGLCPGQQSLVVTAADGVYVVAGAFPKSAQQVKLSTPQPGIAQRGTANIDSAVAYASNDNIVLVSGTSATIEAGQKLFTRDKWRERYRQSLQDASMRFGYHDGSLVMTSKTQNQGFVIRLDEAVGLFSRTTTGFDSMFLLPVNDALYYAIGSSVYQYNAGAAKTFDWWGKDFVFPEHATFGAGYIRCDGPVKLHLYAEGELVYERDLTTGHFRLPDMAKQLRWSVRLIGTNTVRELHLARSMGEFKQS